MIKFLNEKDGQKRFFEDVKISSDVAITDNTDGVYKGVLFEFKLTIPDTNKVLFQAIKYLSHMRIKGESIPKTIMLVALNEEKAYIFESEKFLKDIETVYAGAASKNNKNFYATCSPETINYGSPVGLGKLINVIEDEGYIKVHIDIYDVVGWANRYYSENPTATKKAFFKEIAEPTKFKGLIYAWRGQESDFKFVMDLLNDKVNRKNLGAFYTPPAYCKKAVTLVRRAILSLPKGHDYVIVDRCAGTGNLEQFLTDKKVDDILVSELPKYLEEDEYVEYLRDKQTVIKIIGKSVDAISMRELEEYKTDISIYDILTDDELSHCIVATYELKEWIVLNTRFGNKVKLVIPPSIDPTEGLVDGGDALAVEYFNDIKEYIDTQSCNVIMFENPPFSDVGAAKNNPATASKRTSWKNSLVHERMAASVKNQKLISPRVTNDLSNLFIWSAFEYYLKKPDDYYILFSPPKYFKSQHLVCKEFIEGFLFNRHHFHTSSHSALSCILWKNKDEVIHREQFPLQVFDIDGKDAWDTNAKTVKITDIVIKKVYKNLSAYYERYDSSKYKDDVPGIILGWDGVEDSSKKSEIKPIFNSNIVGYLVAQDFGYENPRLSTNLVRTGVYAGHGFFLRKDNFLEKLPLFCAGKFDAGKKWWLNGTLFKSSDGGYSYIADDELLKESLIYTCLSYYNKCRSFIGSDDRLYQNELCFDNGTLADKILKKQSLAKDEQELLGIWRAVLHEAKNTANYDKRYKYGEYQIEKDLNTFRIDEDTKLKIYDYPSLNTKLSELKTKLNIYYSEKILPKLLKYELIK